MKITKLEDYIKQAHNGVNASFGREFNRLPQNVHRMLKSGADWRVVEDGDLKMLVQVRVIVGGGDE